MINEQDQELVSQVAGLLDKGCSVPQAANQLGFENSNTLYQKLYRLGYRIECKRSLVPIHAPVLNQAEQVA